MFLQASYKNQKDKSDYHWLVNVVIFKGRLLIILDSMPKSKLQIQLTPNMLVQSKHALWKESILLLIQEKSLIRAHYQLVQKITKYYLEMTCIYFSVHQHNIQDLEETNVNYQRISVKANSWLKEPRQENVLLLNKINVKSLIHSIIQET